MVSESQILNLKYTFDPLYFGYRSYLTKKCMDFSVLMLCSNSCGCEL